VIHFYILPVALLATAFTVCAQPAVKGMATPAYTSPSTQDRLKWFAFNTVGPATLSGGVISAAWGTLFNSPHEYGPHWEGFAKRYGMRLTGVSTGNAIEAGLGAIWGEDPRYFRAAGQPFKSRIGHALRMSVMAYNREGQLRPAYARYAAIAGNNFLSNTWRAPSESSVGDAAVRTALGFLSRMAGAAFYEFWPDVKHRLRKPKDRSIP
jgi:hypothetical protein